MTVKKTALLILLLFPFSSAASPCWKTIFERNERRTAGRVAIVLFPFANGTSLPDDEWLSYLFPIMLQDYLALSQSAVPLLAVSPPSVMLFDPPEALRVAREANADYLIIGQFSRQGPVLEVATRLLTVSEGTEADRVGGRIEFPGTRTINDFLIDLSLHASRSFKKIKLSKKKLTPHRVETLSTESLRFFTLGTLALKRNSPEGVREAVARFEESIRQDFNYVPAYLGLSLALVRQGFVAMSQGLPYREHYAQARRQLEKARLLKPAVAKRRETAIVAYLEAETHLQLGESYATRGETNRAASEWRQVSEILGGDLMSRARLSDLYRSLGNETEGEQIHREREELMGCSG